MMTLKAATPVLMRMLGEIPELVPMGRIDRVWVFPPRVTGEVESGLVVLALRPEDESASDQREVVTVEYEVRAGKSAPPPVREIVGRGWAPSALVPQLISGVVRRLGGDEEEPSSASVNGETERWVAFAERISTLVVDPANGE